MGVRGLWKIIEPAGRPVPSPEALSGQRVAIDASIWLYQFLRVVPPGGAAHLILTGLFRRLCKLLYFGIKPVMVFDGVPPPLKKKTTRERAARRGRAEERYGKTARKLIATQLQVAALAGIDRIAVSPKAEKAEAILPNEDTFENLGMDPFSTDNDEDRIMDFEKSYLEALDTSSKEFKSFPGNLQQQLLLAKKEFMFQQHAGLFRKDDARIEALQFSGMQVDALVKRRKVAVELEKVKENSALDFEKDYLGKHDTIVSARKIASDASRKYVLIKKGRHEGGGWLFDTKTATPSEAEKESSSIEQPDQKNDAEFDELFGISLGDTKSGNDDLGSSVMYTLIRNVQKQDETSELGFHSENYPESPQIVSLGPLRVEAPDVKSYSMPIRIVDDDRREVEQKELTFEEQKDEIIQTHHHVPISSDCETDRTSKDNNNETVARLDPESSQDINDSADIESIKEICTELIDSSARITTSDDRTELIEKLQAEIQFLREAAHISSHSTSIDNDLLEDFRAMLTCMGIPWIVAPGEAEAQCAWLQTQGHVDAVITDDNDVFLFGATRVYRHFFNNSKRVSLFLGRDIEREFGLDQSLLAVMALLLGSDYCVGVKGLGPIRSFQLIKTLQTSLGVKVDPGTWIDILAKGLVEGEWPLLEDPGSAMFLTKLSLNCPLTDASLLDCHVVSAYMRPTIDETDPKFTWNMLSDLTAVHNFLKWKLKWSDDECRKATDSLVLQRMKQPKPTCFKSV